MGVYRADIEIAVQGGRELAAVSKQIADLGKGVAEVNKAAKLQGAIPASINNYNAALGQANATIRASAAGTRVQKQAIDLYVTSLARAEKAERSLAVAIKKRQRELGIKPKVTGVGGGGGGRLGGVASNAIIGGSFPLLFGQGAGAATGGAIGGAVGGLFGGTGGFAGSLLGTLIGDIASKGQVVKKLGEDIGFSAEQTRLLEGAFKRAGREFDKFEASVQNIRGLSLDIEDQANAIKLVSTLTETFGGEIDKVTNAFTSALESGKVTQATLNQLTSQGIPIQEALAQKYGVSRSTIVAMAKDGKISVQTLSDVLVDMGNKGLQAGEKPRSAFEQFSSALGGTATAVGNVASVLSSVLGPAIDTIILKATQALNILTETINTELLRTDIQSKSGKIVGPEKLKEIEADAMKIASTRFPSKAQGNQLAAGAGIISPAAQAEFQILREQGIRNELQKFGFESGILKTPTSTVETIGRINAPSQLPPSAGAKGPKPPEDRTAQLKEEFTALVAIGQAEDKIRDLLFQGRDLLAAQAEFDKEIYGIERDRKKALMGANYESERIVINKIAEARIVKAKFELEDREREVKQQRFEKELQVQEAVRGSVQAFKDMRTEQELQVQYGKTYSRLLTEGMLPAEAERLANFDKLIAGKLKENEIQTLIVQAELAKAQLGSHELTQLKDKLKLLGLIKEAITGEAATGPGAGPTDRERLQTEADRVRGELNTLTDPINAITTAAAGIGDAFAMSFKGIISGSMTAKEALANFFTSVADMFLDMAAQIITKMITMAILNAVLGVLPGGDPAKAGGDWISAVGRLSPNADGNAFGANGIIPFAKGGIVNSSTVFPFAKGIGLMGEAGPEAILPLKRGADGSLGVMASGGGGDVNVVVNVDAKGSSVEGDEQGANQLGRVISAAVQSELIKQQRPGGILAR